MNNTARWTLPDELTVTNKDAAAQRLSQYFHTLLEDGVPFYSGAMFESFEGGGDAPAVANTFTAADLVAVSLLSVKVPGTAALRLLNTRAEELTALLEKIPTDRELRDATDSEVGPGSPADDLWRAVRTAGVGPVTTSKLLARKRPRLLPVIDSVVKELLRHPPKASYWLTLRAHLNLDDGRLHQDLLAARKQAKIGDGISVIRCFDVVIWMIGKQAGAGDTRGKY